MWFSCLRLQGAALSFSERMEAVQSSRMRAYVSGEERVVICLRQDGIEQMLMTDVSEVPFDAINTICHSSCSFIALSLL